jgi:opacity protein-like surface antigen
MMMQNATAAALVCAVLLLAPAPAAAQDTASAEQSHAQSRMQVTQLKSGWLGAPDVKFSQVNDHTATLVGGYGGWVTEGTLLVGGGG